MKKATQSFGIALLKKFPFKTVFLMALFVAGWLYLNRQKLVEFWQSYQMRNTELARVMKHEHERKQLEDKRLQMKKDTFETERIVREKFKMRKPGEKVIVIR